MRNPMQYLAERSARKEHGARPGDLVRTELISEPEPRDTASPATAIDVLAVFQGQVTGPAAAAILESYFAPGPQPRYDTPGAQAQAQADADLQPGPEPEVEL